MKKLAFVLLAMTSFSTFAQSLERDINEKISRLNLASQRGDITRLSSGEKIELNNILSNAVRMIREDDRRPGPGGGYRPAPGPQFPGNGGGRGRRFDMQATALISDAFGEGKVLDLGGRNPGDILSQCVSQVGNLRMTVSQIFLTSNNNPYESIRIFSSNASDICTNIVNRMKPGRPDWQFVDVSGTFSDSFSSSGSINLDGDRGEIISQCLSQVSRSNISTVSKLTISVNRSNLIEKRIFATKGPAVCVEILNVVNQVLP